MDGQDGLRRRIGDAQEVRAAFEELPLMMAAMDGPELRFVAANAAYRALAGSSEFIGMPLRQVFPEFAGQQVVEMVERVVETGEPYVMNEWRMQFGEGDEFVELFLDVHLVPRFTDVAEGLAVRGVVGYITDVTARAKTRLAAQSAAAEVERRYEQARDVIGALQSALLPPGLPVLPSVRVAGSYLLADADTAAGGDWFDVVVLPDGRVGLVVGDVVGHGVAASAVMAQLRTVVSERLGAGVPIAEALAAVDVHAGRVRGARATTVCVAVLDPEDGAVSYCTAGHPPPLVVPARGEPRYLPATGSGPLGVGARFVVEHGRLAPGDVLVLYSDGILERPGRETSAATVELSLVAADAVAGRALRSAEPSPVERVCTQTLELLVRATGHTDDITLLAAQRTAPVSEFALTVPAEVPAVATTRSAVRTWLSEIGASSQDVLTVQHALGEWVTNAVEHAYPERAHSGTLSVLARLDPAGLLTVRVDDRGGWRDTSVESGVESASERAQRGRGLAMSRALMDTMHVDGRFDGTTVTGTYRLSRPARLITPEEIVSGTGPRPFPAVPAELRIAAEFDGDAARLRVEGPVDVETAPRLREALLRDRRGGTRTVVVDLAEVTHLASAGVAVLFDAAQDATPAASLRLYAPAGSPAGQVLSLVGLAHEIQDPTIRPH